MKIVVLAGGISTERDVSLSSAAMIGAALKKIGHQAILLDVYLGCEEVDLNTVFEKGEDLVKAERQIKEKEPNLLEIKAMRKDGGTNFFGPNVLSICKAADIVFIGLHGESGENGKLQAAFDLQGIRYTGTNYTSALLAMDKAIAKEIFVANQIPTPKGIRLRRGELDTREVPIPCVIKTACGGSSVGVYLVHEETAYEEAKANAFAYEEEIVIEECIEGREFSVGVIEGTALPIIEIEPKCGFYDYKNKYQAGSTIETCPADLPRNLTIKMQKIAEKVFYVLRYETYARVDFLMRNNGEIFCLEANTMPGMTPMSLLPQEAAAVGIGFEELCEKIVQISLKKYTQQ